MAVSKLTELLRESPQLRHEMERFSVLLGLQMGANCGMQSAAMALSSGWRDGC